MVESDSTVLPNLRTGLTATAMPGVRMQPLTVQDGWRLLADGVHIHRWFLHCGPEPAEPPVTAAAVRLCDRTVAVVRDTGNTLTIPDDVLRTAPAAIDQEFARQVSAYIEWAELSYLSQLAIRTVVVTTWFDSAGTPADGRVTVEASDSAVEFAEQLLTGAGACWLRRFVAGAPETRKGRQPAAGIVSRADRLVRMGVSCRFLRAMLDYPLSPGAARVVERRYDRCRAMAGQCRDQVQQVVASLPLIAADLVATFLPWSRRFARYEGGGGVGQSE